MLAPVTSTFPRGILNRNEDNYKRHACCDCLAHVLSLPLIPSSFVLKHLWTTTQNSISDIDISHKLRTHAIGGSKRVFVSLLVQVLGTGTRIPKIVSPLSWFRNDDILAANWSRIQCWSAFYRVGLSLRWGKGFILMKARCTFAFGRCNRVKSTEPEIMGPVLGTTSNGWWEERGCVKGVLYGPFKGLNCSRTSSIQGISSSIWGLLGQIRRYFTFRLRYWTTRVWGGGDARVNFQGNNTKAPVKISARYWRW